MSDRPKSSADAIDVLRGFVHTCESGRVGVNMIRSESAYNFQTIVNRDYDYDFYSDSESAEGETQGKYCANVDSMMTSLYSFKDVYAQDPGKAELVYAEILKLHQNQYSIADRRAADLLGVYFLQTGFPSIHNFKRDRRWCEQYTFTSDGEYTDQEAILLFDDDWYTKKFGGGYSDDRFQKTESIIRWGKVCRYLAILERQGYTLEWNEDRTDCEIKSPDRQVSYGKLSGLTKQSLNDVRHNSESNHRQLLNDVYEAYQNAKGISCPDQTDMCWLMETHRAILNREPTTNQTLQNQGGGTRVNPDTNTSGAQINENGTIRM